MSKKAFLNESLVSKRSEQAKRDIEILNAELQQLIETGRNRSTVDDSLLSSRLLENSKNVADLLRTSDKTTNQERNIKKTDLHLHTTTSKQFAFKSLPITVKSQKEKLKTYDVEQAREYMRKQKERRLNSLKHDLKSSEQVVQDRKQKLKELKEKTSKIVSNNVKRSRSRSKSKEKNSNEDISRDKQSHHISRKLANTGELNVKADVITNIRSISVNDGSVSTKETFQYVAVPDNVTVRKKSPKITHSGSSSPYLIVSEGTDINKAAIKIQAAFRGCKERKRFKKLLENRRKMNIRTVDLAAEETEHNKVPKWLQTKIASAPYNVVQTFKRKLAFAANVSPVNESKADKPVQCTENLRSRAEIKQRLKDSVKNSTHKDLKSFLSHKCLDLDLKKVEELNLISKQNIKQQKSAEDSDSDTSKNIPDLSTESSSKNVDVNDSNAYSLNINSKRLKELKLHSTNISLRANQQLNQSINSEFSEIHKTVGKLPKSYIETFNENENAKARNSRHSSRSNTARKDSSYIPTEIDPGIRCIELDSSKEVTLNSPRNLFNPNKMNAMLLLTKLNVDVDESIPRILDSQNNEQKIDSAEMSENALSVIKSYSQPTSRISRHKSMNKDLTLSNSEVVLEICSHGSKKQSATDYSSATNEINTLPSQQSEIRPPIRVGSSEKIPKMKLLTDAYSELVSPEEDRILQIGEGNNTQSIDDSIFSTSFESDLPTEKTNKILSSTAKCSKVLQSRKSEEAEKEMVLPLKIGETVTTTACSNQINVKFQAELHLLNDFNQSLYNLVGIEKSLNNLHGHNKNTKTIYQNQNTQTSFIISNNSSSRKKNSDDFETTALNSSAVSSVDCSLLNGSVFEKFEKISNTTKDDSMLNDTQLSKNCNNSIVETENNFSFKEATRTLPMSQETLSLQYFEQLIKDEDARRDYLKTIFEIRKSVLMDRNKVDLSMLEIRRKHLIETGQLNEASALKKKQRGILIKLEHEKYEMQRLMQMQKAASKERKNILKQQQNVIKAQLTLNDATTVAKIKKNHQQMGRRSSGPLKVFAPTTPHQQRSSTNHRRSDNSVASRCSSSVAEELIVTTSYYTDSVRLSDGSDNQTVASVTSVTQETSRKMTVTTEQRHGKDGESESIDGKISESDGNKSNSVRSCIEYLDRSIQCYDGRNNDVDKNNDRSIVARNDRGNNVEIVDDFRNEIDCFGGNRQLDAFSIENMEGMATVESQNEINKRVLLMKEDALQKRRKAAEELLEWHQRLLEEEKKVAELEMAATTVISHVPMQQQNKPFISTRTTELTTFAPQIQQQRNIPRQDTNTKTTGKESNVSPPENVIRNISARSESSVKSIEEQVINNNLNEVHSDYEDNDKISSVVSEDVEFGSKHATSDSYSCEFDPGEATDNVEEEDVSLKTVKSSEHNEDANILKSQSTLNEIMHNISIISEELSQIYRISSGNNKLNIAEDGQLVECVSESNRRDSELVFTRDYHIDALLENGEINKKMNDDLTVENNEQSIDESNNLTVTEDNHDTMSKIVEGVSSKVTNEFLIQTDQSVAPVSDLVSSNFNLEEAEIIEQNIRIIEKEIEELQSKSLKTADIYEDVNTKERNLTKFVEFSDKQEVTDEKSILERTENAETTISNNLVTDSQIKTDVLEDNILSEENGFKDVSEKLMEDISSTKASEIVENLSSIDPIEISEDRTSANSESISQNITEILENGSNINVNGEVQKDSEVDQNSEEIVNKSNSNKDDKCDVSNSENNSEVFAKFLHEGKVSNPQEDITADFNQIPKDSNNLTEISLDDVYNANEDSVYTPQSFDLDGSFPEKSEILSSKAPDIIESLNRNTEEIASHSSSKMPEILENLSEAVQQNGSSKTTSPSHSSEPSLEEPFMSKNDEEMSEDFDEVSIDLPSSEAGIAIANDDILNTVRMCTKNFKKINQAQSIESKQDINNAQEDNNELTLDESSINFNATFIIDKSVENNLNSTYVVPKANLTKDEFTQSTFEEDISSIYSLNEENIIDITLLNDSNKENETPISRLNKEERYCSIFGGGGVKYSAENDDDSSSTSSTKTKNSNRSMISNENSVEQRLNGVSSKADSVVDVKKRVSEILADAKQKTDRSTRIQDLYTTTYDVNFTEKASEIASELDQQNSEYISPKLVEVKAEELELLKKQWAIEQEIKQLEEQQLSEQREQLPYQYLREIPNKPPPPYTPPVNQVPVITIPSVIPSNILQLSNVIPTISDHLHTCYLDKSLHSATIPEGLAEFNTSEINELLFDLCKELTETHYDEFRMTDDSLPSWLRLNERLSSLKKPLDKDGICEYLWDKVVDLYGFKEKVSVKESNVMRWSRKKRDHVDEVLVRELQADECNWTNFEEDELIVQDQLVNDLVDLLLEEVIDELKDWWTSKST